MDKNKVVEINTLNSITCESIFIYLFSFRLNSCSSLMQTNTYYNFVLLIAIACK